MSREHSALGVIILAAGKSLRMGRPKLLLPWGKISIIGHLIQQWQALGAQQIGIVHRPGDHLLHGELDRLNFPAGDRIENAHADEGMFSSVCSAVQWNAWNEGLQNWAIVLGDQPHLPLDALKALLEFQGRNQGAICQPFFAGRLRHPVLLPRRALAELRQSRCNVLKDFLQQSSCPRLSFPVKDPAFAMDLDSPNDYENACGSWLVEAKE